MRSRCNNPRRNVYTTYGGRGIAITPHWDRFENFLADMGVRPEGTSLDRIDPNIGYSKDNCRWVTQKEQCRNKRNNRVLTYRGLSQTVTEWAEHIGIKDSTLRGRLTRGWSVEAALTTPLATRGDLCAQYAATQGDWILSSDVAPRQ